MKLSDNEIGYIAGLLDGEGSLNFSTTGGWRTVITAVCNSNPLIISKVESILESWGIFYVTRQTHANFWHVDVKGQINNKKKFLSIVFNSLAGKKEQARLMLKFMERRSDTKRCTISSQDKAIAERVKQLNRLNRTGSVTTARVPLPPFVEEEKIQSELFGDEEKSAEMTDSALIQ